MGRTEKKNPARPGIYKPEEILKCHEIPEISTVTVSHVFFVALIPVIERKFPVRLKHFFHTCGCEMALSSPPEQPISVTHRMHGTGIFYLLIYHTIQLVM